MDEVALVLVVSLLLALLVRIFWRLVMNLIVIMGISVFFAAILFVVLGVQQLGDWT